MEKEQMEQGFALQKDIDRLKNNFDIVNHTHSMMNRRIDSKRSSTSIVAPDLSHPEYSNSKTSCLETISMEFVVCALPNNFFAAYKCNLEIEIQRLEQEFKNL